MLRKSTSIRGTLDTSYGLQRGQDEQEPIRILLYLAFVAAEVKAFAGLTFEILVIELRLRLLDVTMSFPEFDSFVL